MRKYTPMTRTLALEAIAFGNRAEWARLNGYTLPAVYTAISKYGLAGKGNLDCAPKGIKSKNEIYFVVGTHFPTMEAAKEYADKQGMSGNGIAVVTEILKPKTVWENTNV